MLLIFSGLPGSGKSTLARALARRLDAVWLRIDSIEQAIAGSSLGGRPMDEAGYRVGYAVAADNLRLGRTVIADSVNPIGLTRTAWRAVADAAGVRSVDIEVVCSDPAEHRQRVETRTSDIPGLQLPDWDRVRAREYHPWTTARLTIDTAGRSVEACVMELLARLPVPASDDDVEAGLRALEERLLQPQVRASATAAELLADDFHELGRSGRRYDRPDTLAALAAEQAEGGYVAPAIHEFRVLRIADDLALATYRSERTRSDSRPEHTARASLWRRADGRWRMLYHQGTPLPAVPRGSGPGARV